MKKSGNRKKLLCLLLSMPFILHAQAVSGNSITDSKGNKFSFTISQAYFEYSRKTVNEDSCHSGADGKFYYRICKNDDDDFSLPFCYFLNPETKKPMIGLRNFCINEEIPYRLDPEKKRTIINDCIILPWQKYEAYFLESEFNLKHFKESEEKINLDFPVVYMILTDEKNNSYVTEDTFVDIDFLYKARLLELYDKKACSDFTVFLRRKRDFIVHNGEKSFFNYEHDGEKYPDYNYKDNKSDGSYAFFNNNELLESSPVKNGMKAGDAEKIFGPAFKSSNNHSLEYPGFDLYVEDEIIKQIHFYEL